MKTAFARRLALARGFLFAAAAGALVSCSGGGSAECGYFKAARKGKNPRAAEGNANIQELRSSLRQCQRQGGFLIDSSCKNQFLDEFGKRHGCLSE